MIRPFRNWNVFMTDISPAWYARDEILIPQRLIGTGALLVGSILKPIGFFIASPPILFTGVGLSIAGSTLIGASLIQQALGDRQEASTWSKVMRVFAGISFTIVDPIGLPMGLVFWGISNVLSKKKTHHESYNLL